MDLAEPLKRRMDLALAAAREAGQATLTYFQQHDLKVIRKADNTPVTRADQEAEQLLRERIRAIFPDDAIVGEEWGELRGSSGYRWILDPIDGTKSFISGVPLYGTLVGVEYQGQSVIGVIYIPGLDECVYAATGAGAWHTRGNAPPRAARVSQTRQLSEGLFLVSQVDSFAERQAADAYTRLEKKASITRSWGDCYGYLLVATGRAEAMVDPLMSIWDAAALQPILQEAGGTFTDWQGRPTIDAGEGVGTNGLVLEEVLQVTKAFPKPAPQG